ncbi:MAG: sporulation protein [Candidatus Asgardarchaeia archaeon]
MGDKEKNELCLFVSLNKDIFKAGDTLSGEVTLKSRFEKKRKLLKVIANLMIKENVFTKNGILTYTFYNANYKLIENYVLQPNEDLIIPFEIVLPYDAPGTYNGHYSKCTWTLKIQTFLEKNLQNSKEIHLKVLANPQYIET